MNKDVFPLLDLSELVVCLQGCDFSLATEENISRPTSEYVTTLYKQIINSFMGISADSLLSAGSDNDKNGREHGETNLEYDGAYDETLRMLMLNKICFKFFQNIGIDDFNVTDLFKPDPLRTRRLLSAVVNYARFRQERMFDCDKFVSETIELLGQLRNKFDDFNELRAQLKQYDDENLDIMSNGVVNGLKELDDKNKELEDRLKQLTDVQQSLSQEYSNYKQVKQKTLKELETLGFRVIELESTKAKLTKYLDTDMKELVASLTELETSLESQRQTVSQLKSKQHNLKISMQTFQQVIQELYDLLKIIATDLQRSQVEEANLMKTNEILLQKQEKMIKIVHTDKDSELMHINEQIKLKQEGIRMLKQTEEAKLLEYEKNLDSLDKEYKEKIGPKRTEAEKTREKLLIETQQLENEIKSLQAGFTEEIAQVDREYALLVETINDYMQGLLAKTR